MAIFQVKCRYLNLTISGVLILTLYNILLTVKLLNSFQESPNTAQYPFIPDQLHRPSASGSVFSHLDLRVGRWDNSRKYKYYDFAIVGDKFSQLSSQYAVCLATQSSLERLHSLVQASDHWSGPISLAVFAAGEDELRLVEAYVGYLMTCFPSVRERVSIHLALPKETFSARYPVMRPPETGNNCNDPTATLAKLVRMRTSETSDWRIKNPYPQNHLRNVARKGCQSGHVFLTDVDIIPSLGLAEHLDRFLRGSNPICTGLCAYVIPTYEIAKEVPFPTSKHDLVGLAESGQARPFHEKVFIYNQYATNFSRWQTAEVSSENRSTLVSYPVTNFEFFYEPFYVAADTTPPHDERFLGYGYTRNTQVYEMFVAGYQFHVLSPTFTCHWGLQKRTSRPRWRERQNIVNRKKFEVFKREVFVRYLKDPLAMVAD